MPFSTYDELLASVDAGPSGTPVADPATDEVIGHKPQHDVADLDAAVAAARAAQQEWGARADSDRRDVLIKAAEAVEASAEPLAQLLSREVGKPLNGPNARFEVGAVAAWLRATAGFDVEPEEIVNDDETRAYLYYRPLGVIGAIGPWNWPAMITTWQFAPALRMGNAVVVKPSGYTSLTVLGLLAIVNEALPEGLLTAVVGDGSLGAAVSAHAGIDKIMFTGSTPTGKKIAADASGTLKRLTMELGGNDAGIVLDDADPSAIAADVFWGAFINTGQTCACLKRLYVPESLYDDVVSALVDFAKTQPMGVGLSEDNVLGPLQNKAQYDIVAGLVESARDSGATIALGGDPEPDQPGYFYPTTIVSDIDNDNPLVSTEQFGPVLPVIRYSSVGQAIEWANGVNVGLGGSVWGSDLERAREVAAQIETGTVWINGHGGVDPRIPFGGVKDSGYGLEFGVEGLKEVARTQVING